MGIGLGGIGGIGGIGFSIGPGIDVGGLVGLEGLQAAIIIDASQVLRLLGLDDIEIEESARLVQLPGLSGGTPETGVPFAVIRAAVNTGLVGPSDFVPGSFGTITFFNLFGTTNLSQGLANLESAIEAFQLSTAGQESPAIQTPVVSEQPQQVQLSAPALGGVRIPIGASAQEAVLEGSRSDPLGPILPRGFGPEEFGGTQPVAEFGPLVLGSTQPRPAPAPDPDAPGVREAIVGALSIFFFSGYFGDPSLKSSFRSSGTCHRFSSRFPAATAGLQIEIPGISPGQEAPQWASSTVSATY